MNKNEDIAWVTRCALFDDRRAFACLVDKYQVRLKRFFLNLTGGDPVLSDDLAQETFIKVYYNLRSYKGLSSFSTWIYRVAYNVFYDELRKIREWEDASVDEAANLLEQPPERVDRNIDISRALFILRPEERTAITLFFVEDLAVAKIAEIRVLNRLPRKRWSIEAKISFVVSVLVIAICTVLCLIFAKEMIYNPCWTCAHTWLAYMGLSVACGLCVGQLGSFLRRIYDAS